LKLSETGGQPAEGGQAGGGWRAEFSAAASEFRSNFFVNAPPIGRWLALSERSPSFLGFKSEFFIFVLLNRTPKAGFLKQ